MDIKRFSIISYVVVLALVGLGWWSDFSPSAEWSKTGGYLALGLGTLYCLLSVWTLLTNKLKVKEGEWRKYAAALFAPIVLYPAFWLATVHGFGFVSTQISFEPEERKVVLSKGNRSSLRRCNHFLKGSLIYDAFPAYYCIPEQLYKSLPDSETLILSIRQNSFGTLIVCVRR